MAGPSSHAHCTPLALLSFLFLSSLPQSDCRRETRYHIRSGRGQPADRRPGTLSLEVTGSLGSRRVRMRPMAVHKGQVSDRQPLLLKMSKLARKRHGVTRSDTGGGKACFETWTSLSVEPWRREMHRTRRCHVACACTYLHTYVHTYTHTYVHTWRDRLRCGRSRRGLEAVAGLGTTVESQPRGA